MDKRKIKKARRVIGGIMLLVALCGLFYACCAFDNEYISYGQAWARMLGWSIVGLTGGFIYDEYDE